MIYVDGHMDKPYNKHLIQCTERYEFVYNANINGIPADICTNNFVDIYYYLAKFN